MWWPETISPFSSPGRGATRRIAGRAVMLGLCCLLAGCGLRPLYGNYGATGEETLAAVRIGNIPDRAGQQLQNFLLTRFNPTGREKLPAYQLSIQLRERQQGLGIRRDETASRAKLTVTPNYRLHNLETSAIALSGEVQVVNSYDILDQQFATLLAEQDARTKALRLLADDIATRVAIFLSRSRTRS